MSYSLPGGIHQVVVVLAVFTTNGKDVFLPFHRVELST